MARVRAKAVVALHAVMPDPSRSHEKRNQPGAALASRPDDLSSAREPVTRLAGGKSTAPSRIDA